MKSHPGKEKSDDVKYLPPGEVRRLCREGRLTGPTAGYAPRHAQANLMVLPGELAEDFLDFCTRNPQPLPVLDVTEPGDPEPRAAAPGADIRTDLPWYHVFRNGELSEEATDIRHIWRSDFVGFLTGCSFTFERALLDAGIPVRHIEEGVNVPMYRTNIRCTPSRLFSGLLVVSMRPLHPRNAARADEITRRYTGAHGPPIHAGDPGALGIADIGRPDYGDTVTIHPGEIPVFWACGVTLQEAIAASRPSIAVTHAPGHMFVTDLMDSKMIV